MLSITEETVEYLANASCLTLTEEERKAFSSDLTKIISYINVLQTISVDSCQCKELDTKDIEDLRDDIEEKVWSREEFFINAPEHLAGLIKVPVVIK